MSLIALVCYQSDAAPAESELPTSTMIEEEVERIACPDDLYAEEQRLLEERRQAQEDAQVRGS